jgi:hypothetical protein
MYEEHKGVYSYLVGMLAGAVYVFGRVGAAWAYGTAGLALGQPASLWHVGFIMQTPQLFINYKLKSVAAMPWRMMTYRCLNTIIDDLFAFIIKVRPWLSEASRGWIGWGVRMGRAALCSVWCAARE